MHLDCPFPGMDPFLETPGYWRDFHTGFIYEFRAQLAAVLPPQYDALLDERIALIELPAENAKQYVPDTSIVLSAHESTDTGRTDVQVADEAVTVPLVYAETETESFVQVVHHETKQLVTVVELLSPTNKNHPGLLDYSAKRESLLREQIHLVELDLLTAGRRLPTAKALPLGDYYAFVSRWEKRPNCDVYAWSVRKPLPRIRIPLQAPDSDVVVALQAVFAEVYRRSRYGKLVDYSRPPQAALQPEDVTWAVATSRS